MKSKKRTNNAGKVLAGTAVLAAAAGAAALVSNKKLRNEAKSTLKKVKADPRVKKAGKEAGGWLTRVGQSLSNLFR